MTGQRNGVVRVGDEIRLRAAVYTIASLSDGSIRLIDAVGNRSQIPLPKLLGDPSLEVLAGVRPRLSSAELLEDVPEEVAERARWWERHLLEVLTGRRPDAPRECPPRPEFDPASRSLRQRELAKLAELHATGHEFTLITLQRQRFRYQRSGLMGVVDGRYRPRRPVLGRVDDRIVAVIRRLVDEETDMSTGTVSRLRRKTEKALRAEYGEAAPKMPSQATFYRLVNRLAEGRHTFGSARTRRSLAKQPDTPFGAVTVARPGEVVEIDSTPLDVRVVLDDGVVDRVELTGMVDIATRSIPSAVLRPTTKAVDASLLLARALTPEPMRPGWSDALRMSRSVLPHRSLTSVDQRLADAAARPVIAPETIVCDRGKAYLSQTFRQACCSLGINLQPAHPDTPTDKPKVERTLQSVATLFAQYVAGYVGSSVERRGKNAEDHAVWSMVELQALLDEWIVAMWQNRPHDGLRDPVTPGRAMSPNEQYSALVEVAGYVPVPLSADDYIELLPATWRTINSYGIRINNRTYDARALNPYRRLRSGVGSKNGRWEVHYDPYDVSRVWVRNHHDDGWITATWTHLRSAPVPFGETLWQHAREIASERGQRGSEADIAAVADELLDRAERGPADVTSGDTDPRTRRLLGRNRATAPAAWPTSETEAAKPKPHLPEPVADADDSDEDTAEVIPLPVFDARKEAEQWRW
jgi:hypothetical protein